MRYELSEKQRQYILETLIKRDVELCKKANIYHNIRKSERGITQRQIAYEKKVIDELTLIQTIYDELQAL